MDTENNNASFSLLRSDLPEVGITTNILSFEVAMVLQLILFTVVCMAIDVCGVTSNVINIICFVKQGFKDSVNISLLGLAVSDIGCLSTLIWCNICYAPAFMSADLTFDPIEVQYMTTGMMHTVFTRVTGWITAFIAFERCLCITAPLKVKAILTPKRVSIITGSIFFILTASVAPVYVGNGLGWKYSPQKNKTLLGLVYREGQEKVTEAAYLLNNVLLPMTSFAVITICSVILVINLRSNATWRKKFTSSAHEDQLHSRNQRVSKMVVMISILFIACYLPVSAIFIAISLEPEFFIDGKYRHLCIILGGIGVVLESMNSSVNIFIYYRMSGKFRSYFSKMFAGCKLRD